MQKKLDESLRTKQKQTEPSESFKRMKDAFDRYQSLAMAKDVPKDLTLVSPRWIKERLSLWNEYLQARDEYILERKRSQH